MITAALRIIRPIVCLGAATVVALGCHLSGVPGQFGHAIAAVLTAFLTVAACNTFNDLVDEAADRTNRPTRPLSSGRLSRHGAITVAGIAALGGLATAVSIRPQAAMVALAFLVAGLSYSLVLKRVPLIGHLWVAGLFGAGALWGAWVMGSVPKTVWWAALIVTLFLLPRELLKAVADLPGDIVAGVKTAAVRWGSHKTLRAMVVAEVVFAVGSLVPLLFGVGGAAYVTAMWTGAVLPLLVVTAWLWRKVDARLRTAENITAFIWVSGLASLWLLG